MTAARPITIIGGGLAGLTLGIGLRQRAVPVLVQESGHYPRHRVCGEFISGRGQRTLEHLGLLGLIQGAGALSANTAAFFSPTRSTGRRPLPASAICLSRFRLDSLLADAFRGLGGELCEGQRRRNVGTAEGVVRATGRQARPVEKGTRWFGLKAHARNIQLTADLEMHVSPHSYVGLCRVEGGLVNVCGLFRRSAVDQSGSCAGREILRGPTDSWLRRRLAGADFDKDSFCAVAGISLRPHRALNRADCCIGDAITMIPPVTGNGMSMACEAAELAMDPLVAWSRGQMSWAQAHGQVAHRCDVAFARRLMWANWLQRILLTPPLQNPLVALAARSHWFWRMAFDLTR